MSGFDVGFGCGFALIGGTALVYLLYHYQELTHIEWAIVVYAWASNVAIQGVKANKGDSG